MIIRERDGKGWEKKGMRMKNKEEMKEDKD